MEPCCAGTNDGTSDFNLFALRLQFGREALTFVGAASLALGTASPPPVPSVLTLGASKVAAATGVLSGCCCVTTLGTGGVAAAATAVPQPSTASVPSAPSSSNEFVRVWRRQLKTDAQRHAYVRQLDPAALPVLFRTELDAGLFDSIIGALADPLLARLEAAPGDASSNSKGGAPDAVAVESSRVTDSIEAMGIVDVSAGEKGAAATAAADAAVAADSTRATSDDTALHVDLTWAYAFLYQASRLNRFDLTLDFADKATITKLTRLFEAILARQGAGGGSGKGLPGAADVLSLRAAFQA